MCVCLSVCPAFTAYISLTFGWILIKFGENVGTLVRMIVLKFHKNRFSFDVIMTSFFYYFFKGTNSSDREATLLKGKQLCSKRKKNSVQRDENYAAPDFDTSDSDLLVLLYYLYIKCERNK